MMKQSVKPGLDSPDLLNLLRLDDSQFKSRFRDSPILRTKRRGLLRNVCVALGNIGGREVLPDLDRARSDHEPLVAEHAEWAITQIENRSAKEVVSPGL